RMAVRGRTRDRLGGDVARSARSVLNDEWLAKALRQPLTDQAREDVGRAAGRNADNDAHRPRQVAPTSIIKHLRCQSALKCTTGRIWLFRAVSKRRRSTW